MVREDLWDYPFWTAWIACSQILMQPRLGSDHCPAHRSLKNWETLRGWWEERTRKLRSTAHLRQLTVSSSQVPVRSTVRFLLWAFLESKTCQVAWSYQARLVMSDIYHENWRRGQRRHGMRKRLAALLIERWDQNTVVIYRMLRFFSQSIHVDPYLSYSNHPS